MERGAHRHVEFKDGYNLDTLILQTDELTDQ